ncbi:MAG TPA: gluconate 2-dehydrogenase subunit 3 family protein [Flavitalea sp.]|nr:gluconate 2-dehydrogenase subunit 3 family protein [Flavitalea sp.]
MDRREALKNFTLLVSAGFSITTLGTTGCRSGSEREKGAAFNEEHENILAEIADTIIPDTDTPGAKKAGVGPFIVMMINDCYPESDKKVVINGLNEIQGRSKSNYKRDFVLLSLADRESLLKKMEEEAKNKNEVSKDESKGVSTQFFTLIRELTLFGYFTSEIGATQALNYVAIPGRYEECTILEKDQKAWAI